MVVKRIILFLAIWLQLLAISSSTAQTRDTIPAKLNAAPLHKWYGMTGAQLIFSKGEVEDNEGYINNILRFTCFFHVQRQFHYDFSKGLGLYTGFSIINVGFINKLPDMYDATLKQRSYSFGIPLGFKLGNMPSGNYLALGAEEECMFAYKQKVLYGGNKSISYSWFSNNVNIFNPSLFAEIRIHSGAYIRFKYYLLDFLVNKTYTFYLPQTNIMETYTPEKSALYYVSVGYLFKTKQKHHLKRKDA